MSLDGLSQQRQEVKEEEEEFVGVETAQSHPFQLQGYYYTLRQLLADLRDPIKVDIVLGLSLVTGCKDSISAVIPRLMCLH